MSKMSDMTEYHASAYRLPSGFEHCSKLKPVAEAATALDRVKAVVDVLYSPGGCPWDGKQTNKSLLKNLLEETYEYVDAVETHDRDNMREELGDVLLQSVFQARVCESDTEDPFGIDEVADRLVNKLITRHPHVFAADDAGNSSDSSDAPDPTEAPSGEDDPSSVAARYIGRPMSELENACGSPNGSDYEDEPESGKTGYYYYDTFTVSTTFDDDGNEVVSGVW